MMGIWSSTLFGSGGAIQWQRWQGTLELLVAAPPPFFVVAAAAHARDARRSALYSLVATLVWGRVVFGVPLHFEHPLGVRRGAPRDGARARADGAPAGVEVRALPARERAHEPARVPRLARDRADLPDRAPARLGAADLVAARADAGGSTRSATRRSAAARRWWPVGHVRSASAPSTCVLGAFFFLRLFERLARARATLALT